MSPCLADEAQAGGMFGTIVAVLGFRSRRRRQKPDALIVSDRFRICADFSRKFSAVWAPTEAFILNGRLRLRFGGEH